LSTALAFILLVFPGDFPIRQITCWTVFLEAISNVKFPYQKFYHLCDSQGESLVFVQIINVMGSGVNCGRRCGCPLIFNVPVIVLPRKSRRYAGSKKTSVP
jgi:hypothetical protein